MHQIKDIDVMIAPESIKVLDIFQGIKPVHVLYDQESASDKLRRILE